MPSPMHLVDHALVAVHRVHHGLQGWIEELLGGFGIEVVDECQRVVEIRKEHGDLLAFALQGGARCAYFLDEGCRRAHERCLLRHRALHPLPSGDGRFLGTSGLGRLAHGHRGQKAVPPPRHGRNVPGPLGRLPQRLAQLAHTGLEDAITHRRLGPHRVQEGFFGHQLAGVCHQIGQQRQGFRPQRYGLVCLPQRRIGQIEPEGAKVPLHRLHLPCHRPPCPDGPRGRCVFGPYLD